MSNLEIPKANAQTTGSIDAPKEVETVKIAEVKTDEAKALEEAKTNENKEVSVNIEETEQKNEKKTLWDRIKSVNKPKFIWNRGKGEAIGGMTGVIAGLALGAGIALAGGPLTLSMAIMGGLCGTAGGVIGSYIDDAAKENKEQKTEEAATQEPDAQVTDETEVDSVKKDKEV